MNESLIFISHGSPDIEYAEELYKRLQSDRYLVWMDKMNLRAGDKWQPQIEENLLAARKFIVLFSSRSITSDWVRHEGSMAFALKQIIIPVNIEPSRSYSMSTLPIWARKIQLYDLFYGSAEYEDQLTLIQRRLGPQLEVLQFLLDAIQHYQKSNEHLLEEGSLDLILAHYHELKLTTAQRAVADKLIEQSKFKLMAIWKRYDTMSIAYKRMLTERLRMKQAMDGVRSDKQLLLIALVFYATAFVLYVITIMLVTRWESLGG
jgi:hypothetical protein